MALLVKKKHGGPCWCHPKSWGLRCTSWRHAHGEKTLMCGGRHSTIFCGAREHPRYHPRPTLQPYHGKKKLPQEKGKTDPAIRVAIRQRFPAIWNRKHPSALLLFCAFPKQGSSATRPPAIRVAIRKRHPAIRKHVFGNSAARCMPKTWVYRPFGRQFGWQFASNSRQFGTLFGNSGVLRMPKT